MRSSIAVVMFVLTNVCMLACGASPTSPANDAAAAPDAEVGAAFDARDQILYLAMIDRFANGNTENDRTHAGDDCLVPDHALRFHGGDLAGLRAQRSYLQELGVDTVWITPVYEQTHCGSHGYWPAFETSGAVTLDPHFGTAQELTAFIDDLHGAGMRLVLDMVVNHSGYDAPLVSEKPEWFHSREGCDEEPNEVLCPLSNLPDFAQEDREVAEYLTRMSRAWAETFEFDGVRMDTAKHVPLSYFRDSWLPAMRSVRSDLFVIAEVFDESGPQALERFVDAGFSSVFDFPLRRVLVETFAKGGSLNALADQVKATQSLFGHEQSLVLVNFLANHDVPRFLDLVDAEQDSDARVRAFHLAMTAIFTLPGIPQIYAGDELCLEGEWPLNRRDMPAWSWTAEARGGPHEETPAADAQACFELVSGLVGARRELAALRRGRYVELWQPGGGAEVYAFLRTEEQSRVLVVFHMGDEATSVEIPVRDNPKLSPGDREALADGARLLERFSLSGAGGDLTVQNGAVVVPMAARSATIYRLD